MADRRDRVDDTLEDCFEPTVCDSGSAEALNAILDVRESCTAVGIEPEVFAYAALYTALIDLVCAFGEDGTGAIVDALGERVKRGEFTHYTSLQ